MTKIICRASDCIFWEEGVCSSDETTYDPENGCLTYEGLGDVLLEDDGEWEEEEKSEEEPLEWEEEEETPDEDENEEWDT